MRRRRTSPQPSEEEEEGETDQDEEWTPSVSGDRAIEAVPGHSGVRTLRKRVKVNYTEPEVPQDDHYYFCDQCGEFFLKECDKHGPPVFIEDVKVALPETDRARKTLPSGFKKDHSQTAQIADLQEEEAVKSGYSWVIRRERSRYDYIDAKDETRSNWMRYVNCARNETEQNLIAFQHRGQVLYRCCGPVARGEELLVWYGDDYAKELGIIFDELWDNKSSATGVRSKSSQTQAFSCSECPYAFTSQLFFHKHIKRSHDALYWQMVRDGEIDSAACQQVRSSVTSQKQTQTHACKQCDKTFITPSLLKIHQLVHTGEKPFHCNQCDKSFSQKEGLMSHQRVHTGEKPFHCNQCDKSFSHLKNLNRHQHLHTGEKPYGCNQCGKSFIQKEGLMSHQCVHTGEKPYACNHCERSFSQLHHLKTHQRVHTGEKPYACNHCERSFSQLDKLKRHHRVHTGEKPFHCNQCDKSFSQKEGLMSHQRVHTGEKPYACNHCERSFSHLHSLKTHQRVHTGEKPYACNHCERSFSQLGYLKIHQRVHTGEKPYACNHCERSFSRSDSLKTHQHVHTGDKAHACK